MPFKSNIGLTFNCGFCRTFVYETVPKRALKAVKNEGESSTVPEASHASQAKVTHSADAVADGKNTTSAKVCLNMAESFRALFDGPKFVVGDGYFEKGSKAPRSQFEKHCNMVRAAFMHGFRCLDKKEAYIKAFSTAIWKALPSLEKSRHSLSNCVACATQFEKLQESFPMQPMFSISLDENASGNVKRVSEMCQEVTGKPLKEFVSHLGFKSPREVERIVMQANKKCVYETQRQCVVECKKQLDDSALQAAYATDTSFLKHDKMRRAQYFSPPSEAQCSKKNRRPLQPEECERFEALKEALLKWDPAKTLVASELAREFNVVGTDSSHRIKLLACELNPSIPGSEIVSKPKSTRKKFGDTSVSMPVPPSKKRLVEIDRSLVETGVLNEGVPCVPVKLNRFQNGVLVEIEAHSRKVSLMDIRQSLLSAHEGLMRLHSDSEIEKMSKEDVLSILQLGARYSMHRYKNATVEELKAALTRFERNRTIWVWHDHSSLASHGILAVMVGVVYDSIVFKTDGEVGQQVQEFIEEGEIHIVAHGSSSLEDQATLIPERLAELEGLTDDVTSSSGIKVVDTIRFFKGDKPAAEFEAGVSCGGNYPCVGCTCHRDRFADFSHAVNCEERSLSGIQEVAIAGHFGKVPGKLKFYEELSSDQLRLELEKRAVMDYPTDKQGRLATLKRILCGVQRVPSVLLLAPEATLAELHLGSYCVLPCEPLHDLKGYLGAVLRKLPSILQSPLKATVSEYLDSLWKKSHLYGCDLRSALVQVGHIFASCSAHGPASDLVTCLVQVSEILYSKDSDRSPKQCLQLYNCAFVVHQLHCELFGESSVGMYFHALLIHCPVQHEFVCSRSTNVENEERIFKSAESSAKCTDRKPENILPRVLKRLQSKRSLKTSNPLQNLHQSNSRIAKSASELPHFKGTVFSADFIRKHKYGYQAHLQRIGHFLVQGKGVWWHEGVDGSVCFHDGHDHSEFSNAGPELLHFRNSDMEDVTRCSKACWQEAIEQRVSLPIDVIRCFDSNGEVTRIVFTEEPHVLSEPEVSFEESFMLPTLPPPDASTPVRQTSYEAAPLEPLLEHDIQEETECAQKEDIHMEGYVDMAVPEVSQDLHSILQSSVCKAVAKLVGVTEELQ